MLKIFNSKKTTHLTLFVLCMFSFTAQAQEKETVNALNNPVVIAMIFVMIILLAVIGLLANVLLVVAKQKIEKENNFSGNRTATKVIGLLISLFSTQILHAQDGSASSNAEQLISGLNNTSFYLIVAVLMVELLIILGLLLNIRKIQAREAAIDAGLIPDAAPVKKKSAVHWWNKINRFKSVEEETTIDLGHEYDGIRELDNRLPPWWLYGFYLSIFVSVIYLWRFHVSHTAPSSIEEYEMAVQKADIEIKAYLAAKGESVDENSVAMLTAAEELSAGKVIYMKSCAVCHKDNGAGEVGPNLTDDYWMHGGDIKNVFRTIRYGINAMPQWQNSYSNKEIAQVASYVKSLQGTNPQGAKEPQGELYKDNSSPAGADTTAKTRAISQSRQ